MDSTLRWFLFTLLAAALCSALVGYAEVQYLGPYLASSPMASVFHLFGYEVASPEAGSMAAIGWEEASSTGSTIVNALFWNYSVLSDTTFGSLIRLLVLWPLSAAILISFGFFLWEHFPVIGRGSQ